MPMKSAQELFLHELADMYDAEQRIAQMLPTQAKETDNPEIKKALEVHLDETRQQIKNLEQCFEALGTKAQRSACFAVEGISKEHDAFLKEKPSPELLTMFNLSGTVKTEHYEIASYLGLIDAANFMGQQKCAKLLQQNLDQEEAMAERATLYARELGKQMASQE